MTARRAADEARAVAMLQHVASLCDETRRQCAADPEAIQRMLTTFEETLAELAPLLDAMGTSPTASRDAVLQAARQAAGQHAALIDSMSLELDRLARSIVAIDRGTHASKEYVGMVGTSAHGALDLRG
ncbi:MAG: hypothetical protein P3B98_07005 [Gemmatimonadota bacterium]|nr:hypothetical protein [Gemmatimonadota bacterium]